MTDLAPTPPRTSPFAALFSETASDDPAGVTIVARTLDQVQIDCPPERMERIGLPLPPAGHAISIDGLRLLSIGPGRWMAVAIDGPDLVSRVQALIGDSGAAVVDQAHGRATLRLSGHHAHDVLAKGTGIDLHPRVFPEDRVASTALFHVAVTLDRRRGPSMFDVHMPRGYAHSLAERLIGAAREFGVTVSG